MTARLNAARPPLLQWCWRQRSGSLRRALQVEGEGQQAVFVMGSGLCRLSSRTHGSFQAGCLGPALEMCSPNKGLPESVKLRLGKAGCVWIGWTGEER